ncbi:MAG: 2-amino-4-hydroxy-6-hydroxymethyldihydropteridine diphosphokinase [Bellilinea sp.]
MSRVYLALGTNLGDRMLNLAHALTLLPPAVKLLRCSRVYETPPWGYLDQPNFLNMVIEGETGLVPLELLERLKFLEEKIGREKSVRYGPRLIDLDILFMDGLQLHSERLEIPHPRLAERAFVLAPLADLAPDLEHPVTQATIRELLAKVDCSGISAVTSAEDAAPGDITLTLQSHSAALERFQHLPPSHQRAYLKHIQEARKPATRQRRITWTIDRLTEEGTST